MTGKRDKPSLNDKQNLIQAYEKLPRTSQQDAAEKLAIPRATVCSLQRETVEAASDRNRKQTYTGKAPAVKVTLMKWINNALSRTAPLSSPDERKAVLYFNI